MKLVAIQWIDSKGAPNAWEYRDDPEPLAPALCLSVGFVFEETKEFITLTQTISSEQIHGRICIPKCAIKSRMAIPIKTKEKLSLAS